MDVKQKTWRFIAYVPKGRAGAVIVPAPSPGLPPIAPLIRQIDVLEMQDAIGHMNAIQQQALKILSKNQFQPSFVGLLESAFSLDELKTIARYRKVGWENNECKMGLARAIAKRHTK